MSAERAGDAGDAAPRFRVYIAVSADGFIATEDGGVGWLDPFNDADYGYEAFLASIGTVVMGRDSFELARSSPEWPYPGRTAVVLTHRPLPDVDIPGLRAMEGEVARLAGDIRAGADGDIWLMGGGDVIQQFLSAGCVDTLDLYVIPVLLGRGIPLFPPGSAAPGASPRALELTESKAYPNHVVRLLYRPL